MENTVCVFSLFPEHKEVVDWSGKVSWPWGKSSYLHQNWETITQFCIGSCIGMGSAYEMVSVEQGVYLQWFCKAHM